MRKSMEDAGGGEEYKGDKIYYTRINRKWGHKHIEWGSRAIGKKWKEEIKEYRRLEKEEKLTEEVTLSFSDYAKGKAAAVYSIAFENEELWTREAKREFDKKNYESEKQKEN